MNQASACVCFCVLDTPKKSTVSLKQNFRTKSSQQNHFKQKTGPFIVSDPLLFKVFFKSVMSLFFIDCITQIQLLLTELHSDSAPA